MAAEAPTVRAEPQNAELRAKRGTTSDVKRSLAASESEGKPLGFVCGSTNLISGTHGYFISIKQVE